MVEILHYYQEMTAKEKYNKMNFGQEEDKPWWVAQRTQ